MFRLIIIIMCMLCFSIEAKPKFIPRKNISHTSKSAIKIQAIAKGIKTKLTKSKINMDN